MRTLLLTAAVLLSMTSPAPAKDAPLKAGKVHVLQTQAHARSWSLYVPGKYSKKRSWPLVISSHGRGGSGAGEMRAWQGLANRYEFIVACPDMVTATHDRPAKSSLPPSQEDDEVLLEIVRTVSGQFRVNPRAVMITGFSGGGNPSYHSGLRHPDVFTHICTRGGNWAPQHMPSNEEVRAAGRESLQIFVFWGEKDHVLIVGEPHGSGQAFQALKALAEKGYKHVKQQEVPAMGHSSRPDLAADWFGAYLAENAKAFKAGDDVDELLEKAQAALAKDKHRDAVKHLLKAAQLETKHALRPLSNGLRKTLEEAGAARCEEARALWEKGEAKAALQLVAGVKREFQGLACAETASTLEATWKQAAAK